MNTTILAIHNLWQSAPEQAAALLEQAVRLMPDNAEAPGYARRMGRQTSRGTSIDGRDDIPLSELNEERGARYRDEENAPDIRGRPTVHTQILAMPSGAATVHEFYDSGILLHANETEGLTADQRRAFYAEAVNAIVNKDSPCFFNADGQPIAYNGTAWRSLPYRGAVAEQAAPIAGLEEAGYIALPYPCHEPPSQPGGEYTHMHRYFKPAPEQSIEASIRALREHTANYYDIIYEDRDLGDYRQDPKLATELRVLDAAAFIAGKQPGLSLEQVLNEANRNVNPPTEEHQRHHYADELLATFAKIVHAVEEFVGNAVARLH